MALRDDRDALSERVHDLERQLDRAHADIARVAELTRALKLATNERDLLREAEAPRRARMRRQGALLIGACLLVMTVVIALRDRSASERQARCETRNVELESEVTDAEDATRRALARVGVLESIAAAPTTTTVVVTPLHATVRVRTAQGLPLAIDTSCTLDVRPRGTAGECEAAVACGMTQLYPRDGEGIVACEMHDGLIVRAHGSPELGDPTLALDVEGGTLTVSEVQPAWWSVALHVPPPGPR